MRLQKRNQLFDEAGFAPLKDLQLSTLQLGALRWKQEARRQAGCIYCMLSIYHLMLQSKQAPIGAPILPVEPRHIARSIMYKTSFAAAHFFSLSGSFSQFLQQRSQASYARPSGGKPACLMRAAAPSAALLCVLQKGCLQADYTT